MTITPYPTRNRVVHSQVQANLALGLLLGRNNLEVAVLEGSRCLRTDAALLGDLRPAAGRLVLGRRRRVTLVDDALVRKLTAAQELFGKMARVQSVGGRVYRLGDELGVSGEAQE